MHVQFVTQAHHRSLPPFKCGLSEIDLWRLSRRSTVPSQVYRKRRGYLTYLEVAEPPIPVSSILGEPCSRRSSSVTECNVVLLLLSSCSTSPFRVLPVVVIGGDFETDGAYCTCLKSRCSHFVSV